MNAKQKRAYDYFFNLGYEPIIQEDGLILFEEFEDWKSVYKLVKDFRKESSARKKSIKKESNSKERAKTSYRINKNKWEDISPSYKTNKRWNDF